MLRLLYFAIFIVFLCAAPAVLAKEEPPAPLTEHILTHPLVHKGTCNILHHTGENCLIFFDEAHQVIWIVLFNRKVETTYIYAVKGEEKKLVWRRSDLTI